MGKYVISKSLPDCLLLCAGVWLLLQRLLLCWPLTLRPESSTLKISHLYCSRQNSKQKICQMHCQQSRTATHMSTVQ
jgi:hypothetical protein